MLAALVLGAGVAWARAHKKPKAPPARGRAKPPAHSGGGCGATWHEAKQRRFAGCRSLDELLRLFEAYNRDGDTPFAAVAAVCYARGGDALMAECMPRGDECPASRGKDACLDHWFTCCRR